MRFPRIYASLKAHGHSAHKASQIILDARRGSPRALLWIKLIVSAQRLSRHQ